MSSPNASLSAAAYFDQQVHQECFGTTSAPLSGKPNEKKLTRAEMIRFAVQHPTRIANTGAFLVYPCPSTIEECWFDRLRHTYYVGKGSNAHVWAARLSHPETVPALVDASGESNAAATTESVPLHDPESLADYDLCEDGDVRSIYDDDGRHSGSDYDEYDDEEYDDSDSHSHSDYSESSSDSEYSDRHKSRDGSRDRSDHRHHHRDHRSGNTSHSGDEFMDVDDPDDDSLPQVCVKCINTKPTIASGHETHITKALSEKQLLTEVATWNPETKAHEVLIEPVLEIMIASLASSLVTEGVTPFLVPLIDAKWEVGRRATLRMITELGGTERNFRDINNCEQLHEFLHAMDQLCGGDAAIGMQSPATKSKVLLPTEAERQGRRLKVIRIDSDDNAILTKHGQALLWDTCTEILLVMLHTIACLQASFGIVTGDSKLSNVVLKFVSDPNDVTPEAYARFRDVDLGKCTSFALADDKGIPRFRLPNRGFIPKLSDFGMASAYGIRIEDGSTALAAYQTYLPRRVAEITRYGKLHVAAKRTRDRQKLVKIATSLGFGTTPDLPNARQAAGLAASGAYRKYAHEWYSLEDTQKGFGLSQSYDRGYDAHLFIGSLCGRMQEWFCGTALFDLKQHPAFILAKQFGCDMQMPRHRKDTKTLERPYFGRVTKATPIDMLAFLCNPAGPAAESVLHLLVQRGEFEDKATSLIVSVPAEPMPAASYYSPPAESTGLTPAMATTTTASGSPLPTSP